MVLYDTVHRSRRIRIFCTLLLTAVLMLSWCAPVSSAQSDTFATFSTERRTKERVSLDAGTKIQMQVHVTESLKSVGVQVTGGGAGRKVEVSLYKWHDNIVESLKETPVLTQTLTGWRSEDILAADTAAANMDALPAGEYVYQLEVTEGSIQLTKYSPTIMGVRCYEDGYLTYASFAGQVVLGNGTETPYNQASDNKNYPYNSAPPEWQIPEDSAIYQMGVDPTQWAAVDGLGRTLPGYSDVGAAKNKKVGIFYWTWHYNFSGFTPINITKLMLEHPELKGDYHNALWNQYSAGSYFWNEPLFGYYTEYDDYVLRKHAELLADAGVDFILFDCTNGDYTWEPAYMNLLRVWSEAREQGVKTPQVAFMMQFGVTENTLSSLKQVYNAIYREGKYQDLWFYWEGKPLMMAFNSGLDPEDMLQKEILEFFTFRAGDASYFGGDNSDAYWGWLHTYPQALYKNADGSVEMTTVGIAMNANWETMSLSAMNNPHNMGRSFAMQKDYSYSYQYRGNTITVDANIENSKYYGRNFQEQWDYAIAQDPEIIFVTGWNEWIAGRYEEWGGVANAFPDQYDDENSRDIEPSAGDLKDYYYYQLVANIRRFKGVNRPQAQTGAKTIDITGSSSQWLDSNIITYNHYIQNTYDRDAAGWGNLHYENNTMRNDIRTARVSYDSENLYFYVETVDALSSYTDANWMRLLLDTQEATADSKDWEEFEYILNRVSPSASEMTLERSKGGWEWETVGNVRYTVQGNVLQVEIPRAMLGLTGDEISFNFKWCDNNISDGDIMSLYTDGDAAPGGRFAFRFSTVPVKEVDSSPANILQIVFIVLASVVVIGVVVVIVVYKRLISGKKA